MVQLSPDTRNRTWDGSSGYHYSDPTILGFSHTHLSGTGCADLGDFLFLPFIGENIPENLPFSHDDEEASPGYYKVVFPDAGITAELTATTRTGVHRYSFKGEGERHILIDAAYNIGDTHPDGIFMDVEGDSVVKGGRHVSGWSPDRQIYFNAAFSVPFSSAEKLEGDRMLLTFPETTGEVVVSVGLSQVDTEGAARNLAAEVGDKDFDAVRSEAVQAWIEALGAIKVEGGSKEARANFYSALYHTMVVPNRGDDVDGCYRDFRQEIVSVPEGRAFYSTLSLWDTFRTWNPLMTLINAPLVNDMVFSLMDMAGKGGRLPMWPLASSDTECMIGYHAVSMMADAWIHLHSFDFEDALEAMVKASNTDASSDPYNAFGYIPANIQAESVSKTLEFAYDDWCIGRMAELAGKEDLAKEYYARARRYTAIFDASTGFMRARNSEGNWMPRFNPIGDSRDYTEGIPWQYRFFAPHDFYGLTALMGGKEAMTAALDSLFTYDERDPGTDIGDMTGLVGQYAHGNEPSHATAWLYTALGDPSSSQRYVREIIDNLYSTGPDGLCGNEDCGQMSAWYVFGALGFYPLCPGTGEYVFSAPVFPKTTVSLGNGKQLTITADHPEYAYIKEVTFNGEPVQAQYITFDQLMGGGELSFKLSKEPCHDRDALKAPYSMSDGKVVSTPYLEGNPRFFDKEFMAELRTRTEGAEIRYSFDGEDMSIVSDLYEKPIRIDQDVYLVAQAFKDGFEPSPKMVVHAFPIDFLPAKKVSGPASGCLYTYHLGEFKNSAGVLASPVVSKGVMPSPSIASAPDADHFGYVFTGYVNVPEDGLWEFALRSDDGSVLYIDNRLAVNNDGSHSDYTATGQIALRKGLHSFRLVYLEDYEGQVLGWSWKAPGSDKFTDIPESAICH